MSVSSFDLHFVQHGNKGLETFLLEGGWDGPEQFISERSLPAHLVYNDYVWWVTYTRHIQGNSSLNEEEISNHWEPTAIALAAPKWENWRKFTIKRAVVYRIPQYMMHNFPGVSAEFVMLDDEFTRCFDKLDGTIPNDPPSAHQNPPQKGGDTT